MKKYLSVAFLFFLTVAYTAISAIATSSCPGCAAATEEPTGVLVLPASASCPSSRFENYCGQSVTTYHYDNLRTGWNNRETMLAAANFPKNFGIVATATLDDQVDAQPLVVQHLPIAGNRHNVVYVATESNTVYAIDASTGEILLSRNLGAPVPLPLGCNNNGPNVGINSTPAIDVSANALYVIAYVNGASPAYSLHSLRLTDLSDNPGSPVLVAASGQLSDGSTFTFNATYERQRPGLLLANGNIYAGFGSFCDSYPSQSRGWVLGWNASSLAPLSVNQLTDSQATDPGVNPPFFLTSVWMSGYGIASDGQDLYFATGNSDCNITIASDPCPPASTWNPPTHIQESVARLSGTLSTVKDVFTPLDPNIYSPSTLTLDANDGDLGSGGVLLLPRQSGPYPNLAVAAGKDGRLFLLNRDNLSTPIGI